MRLPRPGWRVGLFLLAAAGLGIRVWRAARAPALPDEAITIGLVERIFRPGAPWPLHGGDHPFLGVYLLAASAWAFGRSLLGYRLLSAVAGAATVALTGWATARSASRAEGLVAAGLLAVNGFHVGLTSSAFEMGFEVLFVTAAWAVLAGRPGSAGKLTASGVLLGLAFLCNESAALVGLGWLLALAWPGAGRARVRTRDVLLAGAVFVAVISPDLAYNLTARTSDYRYVNYADHLMRIARPTVQLDGLGFFLRDGFNAVLGRRPGLWIDDRCEYAGAGITLGLLLLAGFVHVWRRGGDPSGGLWRAPTLLFLLVVTFTAPLGRSQLDRPNWAWCAPVLGLVSAMTARLVVVHWRRLRFVLLLAAALMLGPAPRPAVPCPSLEVTLPLPGASSAHRR